MSVDESDQDDLSASRTPSGGLPSDGLVAAMLGASGLFVLMQVTWLRGRIGPWGSFVWNLLIPTVLGVVWGALASGEASIGMSYGVAIGLIAGFAALWLGDLKQLRRKPVVFISYRVDDSAHAAARLDRHLAYRCGRHRVFLDKMTLAHGRDFRVGLRTGIERSDMVLVVIGPQWADIEDEHGRRLHQPDDYVRLEVETAFELGKPVTPVLVSGADLPEAASLPTSLRTLPYLHAARLREQHFADDCARLAEEVEKELRPHIRDSFRAERPHTRFRRTRIALLVATMLAPFAWIGLEAASADERALEAVALSPDGKRAASAGTVLRVWDLATGDVVLTGEEGIGLRGQVAWSPDGRWLATGGPNVTLLIWDAHDLTRKSTLTGQSGYFSETAFSWSSDSTRIAAADDEGLVRVWRYDQESPVATVRAAAGLIAELAWSPTEPDLLAVGPVESAVKLFEVSGADPKTLHSSAVRRSGVGAITWSPDGRRFASTSPYEPYLVVHTVSDTAGRDVGEVVVAGLNDRADGLAWSPDSQHLAGRQRTGPRSTCGTSLTAASTSGAS